MILTYKIQHNQNFAEELKKAKEVAEFAISHRDLLSSKNVSYIGLKSAISNQILRKYGKNYKCKEISNVNLIIPNQVIKYNKEKKSLYITPLKLNIDISYLPDFLKVNQIELSSEFAFIAVSVSEIKPYQPLTAIGLDRNATSHVAVLANPSTGKILKLGKSCLHIRNKYSNIRRTAMKNKSFSFIKKLGKRESNIIKDINHKVAKDIIQYCLNHKAVLVLEDLKGISKRNNRSKKLNGMVHSWSFYQLEQFLLYKATLYGVPIVYVRPHHTSKTCSRCNECIEGSRQGKLYHCKNCKHIDHADVNAAFNIAQKYIRNQSILDRVIMESTTDGV